ncbi:MAG: tyrosine protein phosphatase [Alphaproteobacteria bacterium]|nr:tyrosine protein phosphatase [Alphaproteobacteria bacterium]
MSRLHWIAGPGRLAIMARPRANDWLEADIEAWKAAGVEEVVSLLEPAEVAELDLSQEPEFCRRSGIAFLSFPVPDRGVPDHPEKAWQLASRLAADLSRGRNIAIHCRAGIGRSSLVAACVLICSGIEPRAALAAIGEARGLHVPDTEEQADWILAFGLRCRQ